MILLVGVLHIYFHQNENVQFFCLQNNMNNAFPETRIDMMYSQLSIKLSG